ncbi:PRC-barrel domain-containing protein [Paenibacillus sp. UMB4589-SE434]|uniref:PRC-barrel domain-containing protein n=1 Tax=Paenibacillus sp. UMB4589-SE434 TaxID=3046314 RepID=UPI002550D589|nr:PRC-barrel domain-containing protein [Paenibacillus sp. UMB4589-SE434]MDK8181147.1 PRC-barrel domain-containing protein [Paenibacillus sp. UMB4589-SE434]
MKVLELIGLPVYDIATGKRVSKIKDVWITDEWLMTHVELEEPTRFTRVRHIIPWHDIKACGEDAIMIENSLAVREAEAVHIERARAFLTGPERVKDLPVVTQEGNQLGWVADVYFQPNLGNTITGLEISDGLLADLLEGRRQLDEANRHMRLGQDTVVVSDLVNPTGSHL